MQIEFLSYEYLKNFTLLCGHYSWGIKALLKLVLTPLQCEPKVHNPICK